MTAFSVCVNAVIPIFLIMALGCLARRLGAINRADVPKLNRLLFRYFMPVMLFYNIYTSDLSSAVQPKLLIFAAVGVFVEYLLAFGYVMLTEKDSAKRGVKIQGIYRSNFVIIGLPLATALVPGADVGPVVVLIAVVVPMFNAIAVITLEMFNGNRPKPLHILADVCKNPLILGTVVGIALRLLNIELPAALLSTIKQIGAATNPMMLFMLGAFFQWGGIHKYIKDLIEVCLGRLVVMPGIFLTAAYFLGIRGIAFAGMIAIFGSATAIASFTMVQQMGGDDELAGDIVVATSALCCFTMFAWSLIFKSLGVF